MEAETTGKVLMTLALPCSLRKVEQVAHTYGDRYGFDLTVSISRGAEGDALLITRETKGTTK